MRTTGFAIIMLLTMTLGLTGRAFAQTADAIPLKIAYVDLQRVLLESIRGQDAKRKIEKFFDEKQAALDLAQESVTKMEREYYETKPILTEDAAQRKQDEIRNKRIELKRLLEDAESELQSYEARISQRMKDDVFKIIKEFGAKEGYSLVLNFQEGIVLYIDPSLDVTKQTITLFDGMGGGNSAGGAKTN